MSVRFELAGKRVFVAGHTGMAGSAIVRRLRQEPCEVLAPRLHHRGVGARHGAHGFVPAWIAMMPPAVMR